ncbi:trypsin-like peptidase domain-containing protein [candidate division WOR-3 bacterium]|nr:trypsin-like peptidase domain-containing protein [candidate division WOR-3 bacterium]
MSAIGKGKSVIVLMLLLMFAVAAGQRKVAEETTIFQSLRDGVFTVFGDRGHGSGFLVDKAGLVLTNAHVVSYSNYITVQLDDATRVSALLLEEDKPRDVAVLLIASDVIGDRPVLNLATRPALELAFEGEKVIAIGSPLSQTRILTSGIVSKVEESAIITDVNINPGNSGGPLLNMDSEVIAINTFRDPSPGGPGVAGSISISAAAGLITRAQQKVANVAPPSAELLPVKPKAVYPPECFRWAQKRCSESKNYTFSAGSFDVFIITPPRGSFIVSEAEKHLTDRRRQREAAAGVEESKMYDPLGNRLREWMQYVGEYAPVVKLHVRPKVGMTGASLWLNMLGAVAAGMSGATYEGYYSYEFKGDLQDFTLYSNDRPVHEVMRGMNIMPVSYQYANTSMDDIAQQGVFIFLPDPFYEYEAQALKMKVVDLKKLCDTTEIAIPRACLEQIWVDFEPYRDALKAKRQQLAVK